MSRQWVSGHWCQHTVQYRYSTGKRRAGGNVGEQAVAADDWWRARRGSALADRPAASRGQAGTARAEATCGSK